MSNNKEDKTQAAAALFAAKGMSRAQAERAAAAQARNVNAYGQKEEGPSRWQERKEAKRQMYLMSTEKAVRLGERKDLKSSVSSSVGGASAQCQKCFQFGHWTYECKNERVYMSRPSRTQQLKNPKLKMKLTVSYELDGPDIPKEEKDKKSQRKEKGEPSGVKSKRKHRSLSDSDDDRSEASVFNTDGEESSITGSDSTSNESSSSYTSSDSDEERRRRRRRRKQKKRRHQRDTSSSDSSESESASDSDSDDRGSRRRTRRHGKRH